MADVTIDELLRLISNVERTEEFDNNTGYETYRALGYLGEIRFPLDLKMYELMDEKLGIYRLRDEYNPREV